MAAFTLMALSVLVVGPASVALLASDGLEGCPSIRASMYMQSPEEIPIADAGPDQTVTVRERLYLNGSGSADDVGIESYTWTFFYGGLNRTLTGVAPTYVFTVPGTYEITLNVTDVDGHYDTDTVSITVLEQKVSFLEAHWMTIAVGGACGGTVLLLLLMYYRVLDVLSEPRREKMRIAGEKLAKMNRQLLRNPMGLAGSIILTTFIIMAILGPTLAPYSVDFGTLEGRFDKFLEPSSEHWMGTDGFGFDIFSELLYGARTSIIVGVVSAVIASVVGAAIGLYSGYAGGWKDEVLMRVNDIVLSIPWLVLMIVVAAFMDELDLFGIILIIGLTGWSSTARMVRSQVLSLKERQYVERARAIGATDVHIIWKHVLPNAFPLVFANTILTVAVSILSESTLSFLGLRPQGTVTWGTMLSYATESDAIRLGLEGWLMIPGLCIVLIVLGFTLLGYALDDIMNPKLRKR
jgi:peptide/nickel transport system permease protein